MNQYMDLDIVGQCKPDLKDILGESHIPVDNLAVHQAFHRHKNKQHDHRLHGTLNSDHMFPKDMGSHLEEVQSL